MSLRLCRLFYTIQGASLWSFVRQWYFKLRTKRVRNFRVASESTYLLGSLLLLVNSAAITDNWFHLSSSTFPTNEYREYQPSNQTLFGRQLDSQRCSQYASSGPGYPSNETAVRQLCGILTDEGAVSSSAIAEAQQVWANISGTTRIAMTQDQHAILVPANLPGELRYRAVTVGVKTTCERCGFDLVLTRFHPHD